MVSNQKQISDNEKLLENESEEALLTKIAEIQSLLDEEGCESNDENVIVLDSSDEENNEPQKCDRTRHGSPYPSVRPVTPASDSDENNDSERYSQFGNRPFYSLPSTSKGYSGSLRKVFDYKNEHSKAELRNEEKQYAKGPKEDVWVPLTFLEPRQANGSKNYGQALTYKPKVPDLSRNAIIARNMMEKSAKWEEEEKANSEIVEAEVSKEDQKKKTFYFPDIAEKRKKKRKKKLKEAAKASLENAERQKEVLVKNPLTAIKKQKDDYYRRRASEGTDFNSLDVISRPERDEATHRDVKFERKRKAEEFSEAKFKMKKTYEEQNCGTFTEISRAKLKESTQQLKQKNLSEDIKPNINNLSNLGQNFNACVTIAANLPDDALLPFRFLNFPGEIKTENQSELTSTGKEAKKEIEPNSINQDISKIVCNILKQEEPDEDVKIISMPTKQSKSKKIDFSRALKTFSQKLKILKNKEEKPEK